MIPQIHGDCPVKGQGRPPKGRRMDRKGTLVLGSALQQQEWKTMAKVGDKVPSATLRMLGPEGPKPITTEELFAPGKKVVAFALPGAFTPTCSAKHVAGFVAEADKLKAKGVD